MNYCAKFKVQCGGGEVTENRKNSGGSGQWSVVSGQWSVVSVGGRWSVVSLGRSTTCAFFYETSLDFLPWREAANLNKCNFFGVLSRLDRRLETEDRRLFLCSTTSAIFSVG